MAHIPVNHPLRLLYRVVAAACGLYVLSFGIWATVATQGHGFFAQRGLPTVLGLQANRAFAVLSVVAGLVIVVGAVIGRNLDRWINLVGGVVFIAAGLSMITLLQTGLNYLGFRVATCVVSFIIGMILFTAGLYGRVGSAREQILEERFRHGAPDPSRHAWAFKGGPKPSHQTDDHRFA